DQKTTSQNPRSTVGTVTEIYDYLRLLWANIGTPHCPKCGKEIHQQTIDQIIDRLMALEEKTRVQILAPVIRGKKGEHVKVFEDARKQGYVRVRVDGEVRDLAEEIKLKKTQKHNIEIVVDRVVIRPDARGRITDSVETATALSGGLVIADVIGGEPLSFSQNYACEDCGISIEELTPRMFSFNNPYGACPVCTGLGMQKRVDPERIIPNPKLSIKQGAIRASGWGNADPGTIAAMYYNALGKKHGFTLDTPIEELSDAAMHELLYGTEEPLELSVSRVSGGVMRQPFEGIVTNLERRYKETSSDYARSEIEECMSEIPCPACHGRRLRPEVLAVTIGGLNIAEFSEKSVVKAMEFLQTLRLTEMQHKIGDRVIKEIKDRLGFLQSVGLEYLTLSRASGTLSGGESQRIRLATQIGSSLMGVLYILDEPSIGLHQRDNDKLLATLGRLRDLGNTLIVVEHDEDTMFAADHIVDIGPGAGRNGGEVVFEGTVDELLKSEKSITGQYLSGRKCIPVPDVRRKGNGKKLVVKGCAVNNLKHTDFTIPLGTFTCVTGVSGSGKSSFVNEILYKKLAAELNGAKTRAGAHDKITGLSYLDKVININQSPIGRTPRSNPATYTGVFNDIRDLFAKTADAKARGYGPSRFSFNVKGGRCEACAGDGLLKIEMHFLPDVYVPCDVCKGKRYNKETLEVRYKGKNIYEVLDMTVDEACEFFANVPKIARRLETMREVGLGYVKLGQSSTTLSGGEAQRAKLATELSKRPTGKTIYILDEPTTGLHVADVHRLVNVLQKLVDAGNTVVVIEHNLDVIKTADYILDLGPEGGDGGGRLVVSGTPEEVAACENSYTGQYLKPVLERKNHVKSEE
ncbi:MAG TPA: excinuclease ABC subunit UvrA, partial [Candidatus Agathobaculum merdigallinarum]|nr:excinuclease ABC subunit UvrA [Candidatus Agathobaculum merdigallinarum]